MIIESLLDTDLYKFTMMQVVHHQFHDAEVEYRFFCRSKCIDFSPYVEEIQKEIQGFCDCTFAEEELAYLKTLPYLTDDFVDHLKNVKPNAAQIKISADPFTIIIKGPWRETILFEIPILAILSEVYSRNIYPSADLAEGRARLQQKIEVALAYDDIAHFRFSDFGTRRRFSRAMQKDVIEMLHNQLKAQFQGTSNVMYAKAFDVPPIGTMAHEYIQACQVLAPDLRTSQQFAFQCWLDEFGDQLGIALSDTYNINVFLKDFNEHFAKAYQGARQDSGDPYVWAEAFIGHLKHLGIDPKTKTIVFSDNLDISSAINLHQRFIDEINPVFGIGSHLTNDLGCPRMDMVIKMVECNGQPVAKLSDSVGKSITKDAGYLEYLRGVFFGVG